MSLCKNMWVNEISNTINGYSARNYFKRDLQGDFTRELSLVTSEFVDYCINFVKTYQKSSFLYQRPTTEVITQRIFFFMRNLNRLF